VAAQDLGVAVKEAALAAGPRDGRGCACRTCRFFGGFSRSGAQAWCLRELPMKMLWMHPGQGCSAHVGRGGSTVAAESAEAPGGRLAA